MPRLQWNESPLLSKYLLQWPSSRKSSWQDSLCLFTLLVMFMFAQIWNVLWGISRFGSLYIGIKEYLTYRRIGHAPSHRVPHLIGHSVGRWISSAKTIRPRNGWSERFRVHHHFVMRVHHSVHAEWQCCLPWTTLLWDQTWSILDEVFLFLQ